MISQICKINISSLNVLEGTYFVDPIFWINYYENDFCKYHQKQVT